MSESKNIPRVDVLGFAYDQYEHVDLGWRFPLNPTFNDLCERAELADMVPIILLTPLSKAVQIIHGEIDEISVKFTDVKSPSPIEGATDMNDLKDIATCDLVAELMEREGVSVTTLAPNSKATIEAEGPAIVLNIID